METEAIEPRPNYPPKPVGVSIKYPGKKAHYYAFGHPTENNCTFKEACIALADAWDHAGGVLCHNQKFDYDVATTHMGMPELPWDRMHDTMMEVFLENPHAPSHGLKQSAERLLGMPPEERDAVKDWLVAEGIVTRASKNWGAFISKAPGSLVGKYADGDTTRTEKLHNAIMPLLKKRKMLKALDRERRLMPYLLDMERQGVPVDVPRLEADCATYSAELAELSAWICKRLKCKTLNIDSGPSLVEALIAAGKIDESLLGRTPTGAWKTDKASLGAAITDSTLASALAHRASLQTCVGTFMQPWLEVARQTGGRIHTTWNQLKQYGSGGSVGAVTGRMSSSPNFQNIPKQFPMFWKHQAQGAAAKKLPKCPLNLTDLPLVRSYIVAPPGHVLIGRDYSQQELRILAHFEDGSLRDAYVADPWLDIHGHVRNEINTALSKDFERGLVKQINFGLIYGMGVGLMASKAGCSVDEARAAKSAILSIYPGLRELQNGLKDLAAQDQALRTWGGRQYHCEPAKIIGDRLVSFEYKMLNVLVQGSAADCTKEAMIRYYESKPKSHQLLLQAHDELLCAVPIEELESGMEILRQNMESVEFSIPIYSEGKTSTTNWSAMRDFDKKGEIL